MSMDEKVNLKLLGKNHEDLKVISAISEVIDVTLHDLGKPWNVKYIPIHKI